MFEQAFNLVNYAFSGVSNSLGQIWAAIGAVGTFLIFFTIITVIRFIINPLMTGGIKTSGKSDRVKKTKKGEDNE